MKALDDAQHGRPALVRQNYPVGRSTFDSQSSMTADSVGLQLFITVLLIAGSFTTMSTNQKRLMRYLRLLPRHQLKQLSPKGRCNFSCRPCDPSTVPADFSKTWFGTAQSGGNNNIDAPDATEDDRGTRTSSELVRSHLATSHLPVPSHPHGSDDLMKSSQDAVCRHDLFVLVGQAPWLLTCKFWYLLRCRRTTSLVESTIESDHGAPFRRTSIFASTRATSSCVLAE